MSAADRHAVVRDTPADGQVAGWTDRPTRLTTVLMAGRLVSGGRDYLCRMRNVSTGGMMVECAAPLSQGDRVQVELRNLNTVDGTVMWATGSRVGLRFDTPIDVTDLLQVPLARREQRPRAPRLRGAGHVQLHHLGRAIPAHLCDVSQSGCRVTLTAPPPIGAVVCVTLLGLPQRRATLRWCADGMAGLEFLDLLTFADLAAWPHDPLRSID